MKRHDLAGMTTNERLFVLGLLHPFEAACKNGDRATAAEMLREAELDEETIERILLGEMGPSQTE